MRYKLQNRFMANYLLMFIISTLIAIFAFMLLGFADNIIKNTLVKNQYTAEVMMKDEFQDINARSVVDNGGGVQIINSDLEVVFSVGLNTLTKDKFTQSEFTEFLTMSNSVGLPYSYSIEYNDREQFWLIVTFPTSIRIDFAIVHNQDYASVDTQYVIGFIVAILLFYVLLLALTTVIYSKLTSLSIINPLRKLCNGAIRLKEGDYTSRVNLNMKNEFGELEAIFNEMAQQIEHEIYLRKQSEETRKKVVLDISHDLKNPLASIMGYAELCNDRTNLTKEQILKYTHVIYENSLRANRLISDLFELSKLESPDYRIHKTQLDICEFMRKEISTFITCFDDAGFTYEFDIPEYEVNAWIDVDQMDRVFHNLADNAVQYNPEGTKVEIGLYENEDKIIIIFKDNGIGVPKEIAPKICEPFVRPDSSRNSQTGGTGLGLAIVDKIVKAHGGEMRLTTDQNCGCEFTIRIPKI